MFNRKIYSTQLKPPSKLKLSWRFIFLSLGIAYFVYSLDGSTFFLLYVINWLSGHSIQKTFATNGYFGQWESLDMVLQSPDKTRYVGVGTVKVDGNFVAHFILWDKNGERKWVYTQKDMNHMEYIVWSKDNKYILTSNDYGQSLLLESETGNPIRKFKAGLFEMIEGSPIEDYNNPNYPKYAEQVINSRDELKSFSPLENWENRYLASATDSDSARAQYGDIEAFVPSNTTSNRGIRLFNLNTRSLIPQTLERKDGPNFPRVLRFSPDGKGLAAGYDDGMLIVWDPLRSVELWRAKPHDGLFTALEWNDNGTALASAAFNGCGWFRSECVAVTRADRKEHSFEIVLNRLWNVARALQWTAPDRLLITLNSRAVEIEVKL